MAELPQIVRQRLKQQVQAHPDADLLTAFAENSLTPREREQVMGHLSACSSCREVVSLAHAGRGAESQLTVAAPGSGWLRWPMLRWAAVGSAATIVLAAVLLRYQSAVVRPSQPAIRAMEESKFPAAVPSANEPVAAQGERKPRPKELDRKEHAAEREQAPAKAPAVRSAPRDEFREAPLQKGPQIAAHGPAAAQGQAEMQQRSLAGSAAGMAAPTAKTDEKLTTRDAVELKSEEARGRVADKAEASAEAARADAQARNQAANVVQGQAGKIARLPQPAAPPEPESKSKKEGARASAQGIGGRQTFALAKDAGVSRWSLSAAGQLQRSGDGGKTWSTVNLDGASFRAISVVRDDIWVGGSGGLLYHSSDGGQRWTRVIPQAGGKPLQDDIVRIEFNHAQQGTITTASGESWSTEDGGRSWNRN